MLRLRMRLRKMRRWGLGPGCDRCGNRLRPRDGDLLCAPCAKWALLTLQLQVSPEAAASRCAQAIEREYARLFRLATHGRRA